jgi:hypothetical protein
MYVWKSMIHLTQLAPMMVLNDPASALPGSPAALGLAHRSRNRMNDQLPPFAFYFHTVLPHGADQIGNTSGIDTLIQQTGCNPYRRTFTCSVYAGSY